MEQEAKKKWNPNPWAVCHTTVDKDKEPEKYERCVKDVKKKQSKAGTEIPVRRYASGSFNSPLFPGQMFPTKESLLKAAQAKGLSPLSPKTTIRAGDVVWTKLYQGGKYGEMEIAGKVIEVKPEGPSLFFGGTQEPQVHGWGSITGFADGVEPGETKGGEAKVVEAKKLATAKKLEAKKYKKTVPEDKFVSCKEQVREKSPDLPDGAEYGICTKSLGGQPASYHKKDKGKKSEATMEVPIRKYDIRRYASGGFNTPLLPGQMFQTKEALLKAAQAWTGLDQYNMEKNQPSSSKELEDAEQLERIIRRLKAGGLSDDQFFRIEKILGEEEAEEEAERKRAAEMAEFLAPKEGEEEVLALPKTAQLVNPVEPKDPEDYEPLSKRVCCVCGEGCGTMSGAEWRAAGKKCLKCKDKGGKEAGY